MFSGTTQYFVVYVDRVKKNTHESNRHKQRSDEALFNGNLISLK